MENQVFILALITAAWLGGKEKAMKGEGGKEKGCQISSIRILNLSALWLTIQNAQAFGKQNG